MDWLSINETSLMLRESEESDCDWVVKSGSSGVCDLWPIAEPSVRVQTHVQRESGFLCYGYEGRDCKFFVVVAKGEIG